jgi:tRNA pseudouridine55 synthase
MTDGVLIVDKPQGPTSHDVVSRLRRILRTRAVGHAGTLDPMATGVLVVGVGEGTKLLAHLTGADKAYEATLRLGEQTDSLDAHGQVTERSAVPVLTRDEVEQAARGFVGELRQRVPEISAVKVAGERLYARARRGDTVDAPVRDVVVHALEIVRVELPEIALRVRCSKGFYVRALARDLAIALGSVGHLTALRRTHSGSFSLAEAAQGEWLHADPQLAAPALLARILPPAAALRDHPSCVLNERGVIEVRHGRAVLSDHTSRCDPLVPGQQPVALVDEQGALRALGRAEAERIVVIRGMSQA